MSKIYIDEDGSKYILVRYIHEMVYVSILRMQKHLKLKFGN